MKIQPNANANHTHHTQGHKDVSRDQFKQLLDARMEKSGIHALIKDACSNVYTEILQEIEKQASDETGKNIDMKMLEDLLDLIQVSKGGTT